MQQVAPVRIFFPMKAFVRLHIVLMLVVLFFSQSTNLYAQLQTESHVQTELISEVTSVKPGQAFWVAVGMNMDEHWHTYWRNPGDSGLKTEIEWQLPEGFRAGPIRWPYPERIEEPPLTTFGYKDEIYLLTAITPPADFETGEEVTIRADVSWLECAEVCIPGESTMSITLPVEDRVPKADERYAALFADARSRLPLKDSEWRFSASLQEKKLQLSARPPEWFEGTLERLTFFPYENGIIDNTAKQNFEKKDNSYRLTVPLKSISDVQLDSIAGVLVTENGWRGPGSEKAVEIITPVSETLAATSTAKESRLNSIWLAILFSFLGGIILNLMPCVLPVLSIKIMGFVNQANEGEHKSWQHGLVFMLGVLASFWVLAGILLILRAGGEQLGWGFQLQSPPFLIILSAFMFLFGLSLFGVFEIGTSLTTVEGKTRKTSGWMGSFVSGVTATIVATPCTAPFMGSALGFALTQPPWVSLMVFTFLGLGMAAPFVLLSSVPALLRFVPKPGRWMESLKQFMGFLLVGTVIWLLWVLGIQAGSNAIILVLFALVLTGIGAWIYGRWGHLAMPKRTRLIASLLAFILVIGSNGFALTAVDEYAVSPAQQTASRGSGIDWQPFSRDKVQELVNQGKPVFIDFTAAWCLSCQVNERVAFGSEKVQKKFEELNITALKADWTSRDERITKALAEFGRNSVPLYVLYNGRSDAEPQILPEIITPGIILEALESVNAENRQALKTAEHETVNN